MSGEITEVTDWRGNAIRVGDTVLYPRMSGRSCEMQEGTVQAITRHAKDKWEWILGPDGKPLRDEAGRFRTREVPSYKFRVLPTKSSRQFLRWDPRPVTIQLGENVTAA